MKNIIRMVNILLAICMLFSSCGRRSNLASDDTLRDTTVEVKDTTAEDTTAEDTTVEDTTAVATTEADTTVAVPNDGKVHVDSIKLDKYTVAVKVGESDMPWVTMLPENAPDKSEIWKSSDTKIATVNTYGKITGVSEGECTVTVTSADNENVSATVKVTVKGAVKEVTYIDGILIANKTYALPANYNPGIDSQANNALNEMINAAKTEGVVLRMISGFRSYSTQNTLYNNYVARDGKAEADRYSARPGQLS